MCAAFAYNQVGRVISRQTNILRTARGRNVINRLVNHERTNERNNFATASATDIER